VTLDRRSVAFFLYTLTTMKPKLPLEDILAIVDISAAGAVD
jgi:hypothetical protein